MENNGVCEFVVIVQCSQAVKCGVQKKHATTDSGGGAGDQISMGI